MAIEAVSDIVKDGVSAFSGGSDATPGWKVTATGTGSSQVITLPETATSNAVSVYVNGIYQSSDYSLSGSSLTITTPTGAAISVVKGSVVESSGGGSVPAGMLVIKPMIPAGGDIRRFPSYWRATGAGSSAYNHLNNMHAVPVWIPGMNIVGYTIHVQGGVASGPIIEVGIYDSNENGEPNNLLIQHNFVATTGGASNQTFATPIPASAHTGKVWLAYAINLGAGATIQFSHSVNSGLGPVEMGMTPNGTINNTAAGGFIISTEALTGTAGTERVWPSTFGAYDLNNVANFPNLVLRVNRD